MHKKEQIRLLKGLIHHLDNKTNIDAGGIIRTPADTYTSEERFDMEWNTFFQDYPQIVGMSGDLPGPDTFLTTEDFGVPVLAVRDSNGKFKALETCVALGIKRMLFSPDKSCVFAIYDVDVAARQFGCCKCLLRYGQVRLYPLQCLRLASPSSMMLVITKSKPTATAPKCLRLDRPMRPHRASDHRHA